MVHEPMFETLKHRAEEICPQEIESDDDNICSGGGRGLGNAALASSLAQSFHNMPYLVASCSLSALNTGGCYFLNEDEFNSNTDTAPGPAAAAAAAAADVEQWSYCCA